MEFSNEIMDIISKIMKAEQIVIYGAKQRASDIFIACETLAGRDKLTVMVTHLDGKEQYLNGDVPIRELSEVTLNQSAVVIIAMSPHFFHEVRQYPQLKAAGCVLYADSALPAELLRYAAFYSLKKMGLDLRLFGKVSINDITGRFDMKKGHMCSIAEKAFELAAEESARYVTRYMRKAKMFSSQFEYHDWLRDFILNNQTQTGINFEFGVASGNTLRMFARDGMNTFYGFDSFEGLPADWNCGGNGYEKGYFNQKELPEFGANVELVVGWFTDTLPEFSSRAEMRGKKADFIHIDCDLYESAKTVFTYMKQFIAPGTIIAFDEYLNYPGWDQDEFKAFQEYVAEEHVEYEYLAYAERGAQACVRILKIGSVEQE